MLSLNSYNFSPVPAACPFRRVFCAEDGHGVALVVQVRINEICRRHSKPFYAGGTFGLLGYIFCDLLQHDYISPLVHHTVCLVCG